MIEGRESNASRRKNTTMVTGQTQRGGGRQGVVLGKTDCSLSLLCKYKNKHKKNPKTKTNTNPHSRRNTIV